VVVAVELVHPTEVHLLRLAQRPRDGHRRGCDHRIRRRRRRCARCALHVPVGAHLEEAEGKGSLLERSQWRTRLTYLELADDERDLVSLVGLAWAERRHAGHQPRAAHETKLIKGKIDELTPARGRLEGSLVDNLASVLARAHGHLQNARAHAHLARVQVQVDAGRRREVEWLREQPHALATKAATAAWVNSACS
jgi:hypothetical protein